MEKITKLGLKGIASKQGFDSSDTSDDVDLSSEDKKEMIDNVMEAMEDYGDIE